MKISAIFLTVMLIGLAGPQDGANQSAKKIKGLQKERIAVLKEMADQTSELFKHGQVPFDAALDARLLVFEAELDAAEKEADRMTLYKNIVDTLQQYEKVADGRVKAGQGTQASLLRVRARRLKAEIDLERAKPKVAK
jgi:outer membrane protein TolC